METFTHKCLLLAAKFFSHQSIFFYLTFIKLCLIITLCSREINYFLPLPMFTYTFWVYVESYCILPKQFPSWSENIYFLSYLFLSISLFLIVWLVYLDHSPVTAIFLVLRFLMISETLYIQTLHGYSSASRVLFKTQCHKLKKNLGCLKIAFGSDMYVWLFLPFKIHFV